MSVCTPVAVGLTVLAVGLLMLNIGLGVYHSSLKDTHLTPEDIELIRNELNNLEDTYKAAFKSTVDYKKHLDSELRGQTQSVWELEHQTKRSNDYKTNVVKIAKEIADLKYRIPKTELECRLCLPGWILLNSVCYYFPTDGSLGYKTWAKAREFCQLYGGDLAAINSTEKENSTVTYLLRQLNPKFSVGFWIGLKNKVQERIWKWPDGKSLVEGYWMDGEPDVDDYDACVAVYARENIFKAWGDAQCDDRNKKWICEKAQDNWG